MDNTKLIAALEGQENYACKFCGAPSEKHPADQEAPADYCHPEDHLE